jgi:hypothetical protein
VTATSPELNEAQKKAQKTASVVQAQQHATIATTAVQHAGETAQFSLVLARSMASNAAAAAAAAAAIALPAYATGRIVLNRMDTLLKKIAFAQLDALLKEYRQIWQVHEVDRHTVGFGSQCVYCRFDRLLSKYGLTAEDVPIKWPPSLKWVSRCQCSKIRCKVRSTNLRSFRKADVYKLAMGSFARERKLILDKLLVRAREGRRWYSETKKTPEMKLNGGSVSMCNEASVAVFNPPYQGTQPPVSAGRLQTYDVQQAWGDMRWKDGSPKQPHNKTHVTQHAWGGDPSIFHSKIATSAAPSQCPSPTFNPDFAPRRHQTATRRRQDTTRITFTRTPTTAQRTQTFVPAHHSMDQSQSAPNLCRVQLPESTNELLPAIQR